MTAATHCADSGHHDRLTGDPGVFDAGTLNHRPWPGVGLRIAECKACLSTLAIEDASVAGGAK